MSEGAPRFESEKMSKAEYIRLAERLSHAESFPFTGISQDSYSEIKATEDPEYATPIDVLIERFKEHGMKVVLGKYPESGNVFILPADSDNIEEDNVFPHHLKISNDMESELKKLILANRK